MAVFACAGNPTEPQSVASVVVTPSTATLVTLGATVQLQATARDASGNPIADKTFTWSSSDESLATVDASGLVTAIASGTATITATTDAINGTAIVNVSEAVDQVVVTPETSTLASFGQTVQLTASGRDASGVPIAGKTFTWSSSNRSVATVDASGLVTAVANGSATVTATTDGVSGTADVVVDQLATQLAFRVQPTNTQPAASMTPAVEVEIRDALGNGVTGATDAVTLTTGTNPSGASLSGSTTVDAVDGVASFGGLSIGKVGSGYTLVATSGSLTTATSATFEILFTLTTVSAGEQFSCGVTTGGEAFCWGRNAVGQLGDGTTTQKLRPTPVSGGLNFQSLSAGSHTTATYACGVTTSGAYCWGDNGFGQLGDGTTTDRLTPTLVTGGLAFQAVSAGGIHTCGLTAGGVAHCWGDNSVGQLGDGTTTDRLTPTPVSGGLTFQAVRAGPSSSCGVTTSGVAYCWGDNGFGQLGDGTRGQRLTPTPVSGGLAFQSVSPGSGHACGVTTTGVAYCWGSSSNGQIGDGSRDMRLTATLVSGGLTFQSVSAGFLYTCGLTTSGDAYCWGSNLNGVLGDGTQLQRLTPVPVTGGLTFQSVSAGIGHACGVTPSGGAYCWGANGAGGLGDGTTADSNVPVRVSDPG